MGSRHGIEALAEAGKIFPGDEFFAKHGRSSSPVLVQWMVTESCPLDCPLCLVGSAGSKGRGPELTLAEAARLLDQVAAMNVRELLLTGGEPLYRPDLPDIIGMMRERSIRWSLNTSVFPGEAARRAMEGYPPVFAAVSLDGPEHVHDRIRGVPGSFARCMDAIDWYARITAGNVAAGTTLSRLNFAALEETFRAVLRSGAGSWGVHLVFPEGRARGRRDLLLDGREVKKLLRFVERKRRLFRVAMADEVGYTGAMEPLLRDSPFFCGAGRTQCVILSDGEVVPCTTTDRRASAGNVRERGLDEIWKDAFEDLRGRRLPGKCAACDFAALCGGGCWLQRRRGTHCFKESWITPKSLAAAAGLALCLGAVTPAADSAMTRSVKVLVTPDLAGKKTGKNVAVKQAIDTGIYPSEALENAVLGWYFEELQGSNPLDESTLTKKANKDAKNTLASDPAGKYLAAVKAGKWPKELNKRAKRIKAALKTKFRSLAFVSLLWRDLALWCLDHPGKRTEEEKKLVAETLILLKKTAASWQKEIIKNKIDSFISTAPAGRHHFFMMSKALFPHEQFRAAKAELSMEHWGLENATEEVSDDILAAHPLGDSMNLEFEKTKGSALKMTAGGASSNLGSKGSIRIFDMLDVPGPGKGEAAVLVFKAGDSTCKVTLPAGEELCYADVLRLAYEQNGKELDEAAGQAVTSYDPKETSPLFLPALENMAVTMTGDDASRGEMAKRLALDLWLF
jgi:radical SAM protein with 4Fe4S-binding SPASM domain